MVLPVKPPRGGAFSSAIHDDVAAEISALTAKATPVGGDFLLIEDSAAGDVKKSMTISALEAILDHGSIAGLGDVADHLLYLDLAGTRAMTGALDMGEFDILNTGDVNLDSVTPDVDDITFYKGDGSTVSLLWDNSDDRWEFATPVSISDAGEALELFGSDTTLYIAWRQDGTNQSALMGHATSSSDDFAFRSLRGNLFLYAEDREDDAGADMELRTDDSSGVLRLRYKIQGGTGDQFFMKNDGATFSFFLDESDDRWEFKSDVRFEAIAAYARSTLTISGGVVTATTNYHLVDTESAAATDDLDTINGGVDGMILVLHSLSGARDSTLKDNTGNLALAGDFTLTDVRDTITLIYAGAFALWLELSRSNNA